MRLDPYRLKMQLKTKNKKQKPLGSEDAKVVAWIRPEIQLSFLSAFNIH